MILIILSLFLIPLISAGESDVKRPALKWPSKYTLRAEKLYLSSGWTKDYQVWYTKSRSRVDTYKGAVKSISLMKSKQYRYGAEFKIHPTTESDKEFNELLCIRVNGSRYNNIEVTDILPSVDDFVVIGTENIRDVDAVKFYYKDDSETSETRKTLWAKYDNEKKYYIPVRYEESTYDTWHGYLSDHMWWEYYDFETNFNSNVFSVKDYSCSDEEYSYYSKLKNKEEDDKNLMDADNRSHIKAGFDSFKRKYNKSYLNKREHNMRRKIFARNVQLILDRNRQNLTYKLAINKFVDRTPEEMSKYMGLLKRTKEPGNIPFPYSQKRMTEMASDLPAEYDARLFGLVGPVKHSSTDIDSLKAERLTAQLMGSYHCLAYYNKQEDFKTDLDKINDKEIVKWALASLTLQQENCGSCWTWGTTAAVEGALARINGGRLIRLANQAVVDCAWEFGGAGCDGGTDNIAYKWMMKYGLPTEEEYGPYADENGYCQIHNMTTLYPIRGFTDVTPYSESALKVALIHHGPLSVSVSVNDAFAAYAGGIFYDPRCSSTRLNHEVTLVGYGHRDGESFWILKNSWGPNWGIDGYMHISTRDNNCGVATEPTYVVF